ncbi:ferrous iron transport protein A [Erysipelotrichaceae bacterium OH741_COT-311]|nr:ferrous iron transport protein A [Erysipelotrichaceae bacterium OH741_COT-311]
MPLTFANFNSELLVKKVIGKEKQQRLLESLGFVAGEKVVVLSESGGNLIVLIKGSRIAIDKTLASRIIV